MEPEGRAPARIVTRRLVLRSYEPGDASAVKDAVDASLTHLRAFMDWAWLAPEPLETIADRLSRFRDSFERGEDFVYGAFSADEAEYIGGAGLHRRVGPGALEIGYWIRASRLRRGLATEATAALTQVAFERCGVERVEIRVDPANVASLGVPHKLGYTRTQTLRGALGPLRPGGPRRDAALFVMRADAFPGSPAVSLFVSGHR
jgi:RimJ/RimL family protein N-acetyltransferase